MRIYVSLIAAALSASVVARTPPVTLFDTLGLTADQRAAVESGRAVAKVLPWGGPSEIYIFGAVHVDGSSETYLRAARDVRGLINTPGYLAVGEFHDEPTVADVTGLTFEPDDVKALKTCREGACDVQLPTTTMRALRDAIDFSGSDPVEQASALARPMIVRLVRSYQRDGHHALGEYRDKQNPSRVGEQFETMVARSAALPDLLPELRRYLLEYPNVALPNSDSFFYWEKVDFGLKPTIRVNHAVIYRGRADGHDFGAVAIKQLYATHYFHTALDVSVCVDDEPGGHARGFYLLTLKGSQQEGLTGMKGSLLRKVVVDKTRGSLETALGSIKRLVEHYEVANAVRPDTAQTGAVLRAVRR
ncbi:MAG TPA: hypothetical protein VFA59_04700 [Vicinamibacterales bacterium]|nr:hypothetical protein [Vicinamibacterales bacterium]